MRKDSRNNMENKIQEQGTALVQKLDALHFGHVAIILGCAFFLISVSLMKSGFQLPSSHKVAIKKITYAEAKAKALAAAGMTDEINTTESTDAQMAMLDPEFGQGSVAGASTGTLESLGIPTAEQSWSQEELNLIPVKIISDNSQIAYETYRDTMQVLETNFDLAFITFALNSDDQVMLKDAGKKADELVKASVIVDVPSNFALYHKFRNIQYMEMGLLAKSMAGESVGIEAKDLSSEMFSVMEKLGRMKTEILQKYNFEI
jgi:hypothetical protein